MGFKKPYGPGFLLLTPGMLIAPDSGQWSGQNDVKVGL